MAGCQLWPQMRRSFAYHVTTCELANLVRAVRLL